MGTTIDALVVTLGLDSSNFTAGQKKAIEGFNKTQSEMDSRLKNLEARNKAAAHSFGDVTSAAQGLFTVLAGAGVASFARDTINSAAALGRMATNANVATQDMSAFGRMIARNGGDATAAAANLMSLSQTLERAKWGDISPEFMMGMSQIGAGLEDGPLAIWNKLAKFADSNTPQAVQLAGQRLGFGMDSINKAIQGSTKGLRDFSEASRLALSPEQTKNLTEAQKSWNSLSDSITAVATDALASAVPAFSAIAKAVTKWIEENRALADTLTTVLGALTLLGALKPIGWLARLLGLGAVVTAGTTVAAPAAAVAATVLGAGIAADKIIAANPGSTVNVRKFKASGNVIDDVVGAFNAIRADVATSDYAKSMAASDYARAIAAIESGSKSYAALGPMTSRGDRAYGKYQVMGANIPSWTKEALGASMTPEQFLASPEAQEAVFKKKFGEYVTRHGASGAAAAWFAGERGMKNKSSTDVLGTSVGGYVTQFDSNLRDIRSRDPRQPAPAAAGGGDVTIENLTINTDSKDPKQHGRLAADAIRDQLNSSTAKRIVTGANTGQNQ